MLGEIIAIVQIPKIMIGKNNNKKLIGLILCGGQSTRMGTDKGLIINKNTTLNWVQSQFQKLSKNIGIENVFISINLYQQSEYLHFFDSKQLIIDSSNAQGPMCGILSAHNLFPLDDILVMGCDMQNVNQKNILELLNQNFDNEVVTFKNAQNQIEPLLGIYRAKMLHKVNEMNESGTLLNHSMYHILENFIVKYLPITQEDQIYFKNFNTPDSLK